MRVPVELIAIIDRDRKDLGDIAALANDIKENGQITAGVVRHAVEDDRTLWNINPEETPFVLVAGERRLRSCMLAGVDTFLCDNRGDLPVLQQKILELAENLHRKDLTWDEEAAMRKKIHEILTQQAQEQDKAWTQRDTARYLGESVATVSRDIQVATALETDPGLKSAGSKKSATRILEMREHLRQKELHGAEAKTKAGKLQSLIVTAQAADFVREIKTATVDLILTDFPYGLGMDVLYKSESDAARPVSEYNDEMDVTLDLYTDIVPQLLRITKETGWICTTMSETSYDILKELFESCCATHFEYAENGVCSHANAAEPCTWVHAEVPRWIWYRPNSQNPTRNPELHAKNYYEPILLINRGKGRLYESQCSNVLVHEADYGAERLHVMQKPRSLGRELVQRLSLPGELVLDPFLGSGNLLAAAAEVHRKISGCDSNPLLLDAALVNIGNYYGG